LTFGGKPIEIPLNYNMFLVSLPEKNAPVCWSGIYGSQKGRRAISGWLNWLNG